MEIFEAAQELEMFEREHRLAETRRNAPVLPPKGVCLFCDTALAYPLRFCDVECCRDWENQQEAHRRNGFKSDPSD